MKTVFNWIALFPLALIVSAATSAIFSIGFVFILGEDIGKFPGAFMGAFTFHAFAMKYAPTKSNLVKWLSLLVLFLISAISFWVWHYGMPGGSLSQFIGLVLPTLLLTTFPADFMDNKK